MPARCLLYYITDRKSLPGDEAARRRSLIAKIAEAARAGVEYIQLREKDLCARELEHLAKEALLAVRSESQTTSLLVNSRLDVALAMGADGVHLRSDDVSAGTVHSLLGKSKVHGTRPFLIAVSCHDGTQVKTAALEGASFVVFGPVFEKTGAPPATATGLVKLQEACRSKVPVLALGGVTLENAPACLAAGASGVAGIRLFQDHAVAGIVENLRRLTRGR
jgi:thiamine-phosphate pyrophosphorylase